MWTSRRLLLALVITTAATGRAAADPPGGLKPVCGAACMEPCQLVCRCDVRTVTETRHCWEVEQVPVCIPKVRCPLFDFLTGRSRDDCAGCARGDCDGTLCSGGSCGRVRYVKRLVRKEYECETQVVEWKVAAASGGGKCGESGAPASGCAPAARH